MEKAMEKAIDNPAEKAADNAMDQEAKAKLKSILLRTKLNQHVSEEENAFARTCWRAWPKEYSALQTEEVHPEAAKQKSANFQPKTPFKFAPPQQNASKSRPPVPARSRRPGPSRGRRG